MVTILACTCDRENDATEQGSLVDLEEKVSRSSVLEVPHSDTHFVCRCATWGRIEIEYEVWTPHSLLQISEVESMLSVMGVEVESSESSAQDVSRLRVD